jgi:hypothetical protein
MADGRLQWPHPSSQQEQMMKAVIALVTVLSLLVPSVALASPADESSKPTTPTLNLKAQGIQAAAAEARLTAAERPAREVAVAPATASAKQNGKKSFWKTPWPYVIIGAAVAIGVLVASGGYGDGEGSGY